MGIGPLLPWRRATRRRLRKRVPVAPARRARPHRHPRRARDARGRRARRRLLLPLRPATIVAEFAQGIRARRVWHRREAIAERVLRPPASQRAALRRLHHPPGHRCHGAGRARLECLPARAPGDAGPGPDGADRPLQRPVRRAAIEYVMAIAASMRRASRSPMATIPRPDAPRIRRTIAASRTRRPPASPSAPTPSKISTSS